MPIELGTFQRFVDSDPQADRLTVNGNAPGPQSLQNARSGNMLNWAVKVLAEYMPGASGAVTAQNNDAITAFRDALSQTYGPGSLGHAPADGTGQPLSSRRINTAIHETRAALFDAATKPGASQTDLKAASDAIMRGVKLTPGPLGPLLQAEVSKVLLNLLPAIQPLDGTPRLDLIGKLGSQLVARLEDPLARALDAYGIQAREKDLKKAAEQSGASPSDGKPTLEAGPPKATDPSVDELVAMLGADAVSTQADPMAALHMAVPALRTHLDAEIKGFETSVRTLLDRVGADHADIGWRFLAGRFLAGPDAGRLTDIQLTNSDPHKGGNRVAILSFETGLKVVYKPRDVRIDDAISGSDRGKDGPSLMERAGALNSIYKFMPRSDAGGNGAGGDYGYVQHLPNREASNHVVDASRAPAMFQEMGRAVAALMLAGATDIHHENLMVSNGGVYFTDLEFALNAGVMNQLAQLLAAEPSENPEGADDVSGQAAQPSSEIKQLMQAIMLDKAFTSAVDDNAMQARRTLHEGQLQIPAHVVDVPESLLIIKTGDTFVNNRYAPDPPAPPFYQPYGPAFGEGIAKGLSALKQQDGLTAFMENIQGLHLRYHPLATSEQRSTLQAVFAQDYQPETSSGDMELNSMRARLLTIPTVANDTNKRDILASTMEAAYKLHDIPYYSRKIGDTALYPDGQASRDAACANFFPANIDQHADALNTAFGQASDAAIAKLGSDAGIWLSAQTPGQYFMMSYLSPQPCDDMIETITGSRPQH